ncbi:MAG: glycogen/starch synthase [Deltaproteobacteria bacterium]|nr:glycogen/starch synthase [Deltaproteobacteria bacterium]
MTEFPANPRILIVTPEVTYLPEGMGSFGNRFSAKAGGLADVSAALIGVLFKQGADVHVALPDYRSIFGGKYAPFVNRGLSNIRDTVPLDRVHLAEDSIFFHLKCVYSKHGSENTKIALALQREAINHIIPYVQPDLIHCNDWMTGLIPAVARQMGIPCLFTIHNVHTVRSPMSHIEDRGIDAASFWQHLFFERLPDSYDETRDSNPVDFLASGVFAAHFVNTVSPTFLKEVVEGRHSFVKEHLKEELYNKVATGCAVGILNAPDPSFDTTTDDALACRYGPEDHVKGKKGNKRVLQETLGLMRDDKAPLVFWPSRLDTIQKGSQLLAEILYDVIFSYWEQNLQLVFVADGEFKRHFRDIVHFHQLFDRVAVCDFDERLARLAYAASDFVLMPSLFEPCGLPQMIGSIYGALPVAHDTGGIHDTIEPLDVEKNTGNGFLFESFDSNGLFWAINQAMLFYKRPNEVREQQIKRIMSQSVETFNHAVTARHYIHLYENMLKRPLINPEISHDKVEQPPKVYRIGDKKIMADLDPDKKKVLIGTS